MHILFLLAELPALGMCQCRVDNFWKNGRHWVGKVITLTELNTLGALCAHDLHQGRAVWLAL